MHIQILLFWLFLCPNNHCFVYHNADPVRIAHSVTAYTPIPSHKIYLHKNNRNSLKWIKMNKTSKQNISTQTMIEMTAIKKRGRHTALEKWNLRGKEPEKKLRIPNGLWKVKWKLLSVLLICFVFITEQQHMVCNKPKELQNIFEIIADATIRSIWFDFIERLKIIQYDQMAFRKSICTFFVWRRYLSSNNCNFFRIIWSSKATAARTVYAIAKSLKVNERTDQMGKWNRARRTHDTRIDCCGN